MRFSRVSILNQHLCGMHKNENYFSTTFSIALDLIRYKDIEGFSWMLVKTVLCVSAQITGFVVVYLKSPFERFDPHKI